MADHVRELTDLKHVEHELLEGLTRQLAFAIYRMRVLDALLLQEHNLASGIRHSMTLNAPGPSELMIIRQALMAERTYERDSIIEKIEEEFHLADQYSEPRDDDPPGVTIAREVIRVIRERADLSHMMAAIDIPITTRPVATIDDLVNP